MDGYCTRSHMTGGWQGGQAEFVRVPFGERCMHIALIIADASCLYSFTVGGRKGGGLDCPLLTACSCTCNQLPATHSAPTPRPVLQLT